MNTESKYRLTDVEVTNYKGIAHASFKVGKGGAVIMGRNGAGKTTLRDAILAALKARGIGPENIRTGSDKSEILIDMGAARVRRSITSSGGGGLTVTNEDGDSWKKPQTRLDALFGDALDPLAFFLAKPADRQKMIMSAMPATVTAEEMATWTNGLYSGSVDGHGLEVIGRAHKVFYEQRTEANKRVKDALCKSNAANDRAKSLMNPAHKGVLVPPPGEEDKSVREAERAVEALRQRQAQADSQARQAQGTRDRIASLLAESQKALDQSKALMPSVAEFVRAADERKAAAANVAQLTAALNAASQELARCEAAVKEYETKQAGANAAAATSARFHRQAEELESTLAAVAIEAPTADEMAAAQKALADEIANRDLIRSARAEHEAYVYADGLAGELKEAEAEAEALDAIVARLAKDAPAEIAARSQMIPGLSIGDNGITLDGKALDNLCGAEQMRFAVDLSKRLSPGGKLLTVNGLEQIDPDSRDEFYRLCMADGWQLIGTLVERGELRVVAIEEGSAVDEAA